MIKVLLCFISRRRSKRLSSQFLCAKKSLGRSEEHTSELQSQSNIVCRLLLEKKKVYNAAQARWSHLLKDRLSCWHACTYSCSDVSTCGCSRSALVSCATFEILKSICSVSTMR